MSATVSPSLPYSSFQVTSSIRVANRFKLRCGQKAGRDEEICLFRAWPRRGTPDTQKRTAAERARPRPRRLVRSLPGAGLAALFLAIGLLVACGSQSKTADDPRNPVGPYSDLMIETSTGAHHFQVELADTPDLRSLGLMYRTHLDADKGMLFDFGEPEPVSFWMENTLIPLDMIFINAGGRVANIAANAIPGDRTPIYSDGAVTGVLEIAGGMAAKLHIEPGDVVRHPMFGNVK
jgi:uncharacterized membrane protein (UPF0127 family)